MNNKIYLDDEGYEEYLESIEKLKDKLINIGRDKSESYSAAVGDGWHDNFEFEDANKQEVVVVNEVNKLKDNLNRIEIIKRGNDRSIIDINDIVELEINYGTDIEKSTFKLVARESHNDEEISINSPLGKAIYKSKVNDIVKYNVGSNTFMVKIISKSH